MGRVLEKYGKGTPNDWLERHLLSPLNWLGILVMLTVDIYLFGFFVGPIVWGIQMIWIPFWAAGIVNGVGHAFGYRNFDVKDASRNISPIAIWLGGEELHNNHHAYGTSAKFSAKWYEFDIGWMYIRTMEIIGLAKVRKVAPRLKLEAGKVTPDFETLQAVITHRYAVLTSYARTLKATYREELINLRERSKGTLDGESLKRLKVWIQQDADKLPVAARAKVDVALANSQPLQTVFSMRQELVSIWERSTDTREQLLHRLQDWCRRAEASGIPKLARFSQDLRQFA